MIVKGIDLSLNVELVAKIKPLKSEVYLIDKPSSIQKTIASFPAVKSTFRTYEFPFADKDKIQKAVETALKVDLPVSFESVSYDYTLKTQKDKTIVFCVIAKKEDVQNLKNVDILDSEVFAPLRITRFLNLKNITILHFSDGYIVEVFVEDGFIKKVRILKNIENIPENTLLSGDIPEKFENSPKLKIENILPKYNVAYGLLLRMLDDTGVDLLHKSNKDTFVKLLKGTFYLFLSVLVLSIAIGFKVFVLKKQIKYVKEKEKEVFVKSFNYSGTIFDPLEQAKSKLLMLKNKNNDKEDTIDVLNFIGTGLSKLNNVELFKITISQNRFIIKGVAKSIREIEMLKNFLSKKYNAKIEETVNTPKGEVRFTISGDIS